MKVLFLGQTEILLATARRVLACGRHSMAGILIAHATREHDRVHDDFRALAAEQDVPFLCAHSVAQARDFVAATAPDAGVSMNWPHVLHDDFLSLIPQGVINAHLGALPRFRGHAAPCWVILLGEDSLAFTLHLMAPGEPEAGPLVIQEPVRIYPDTTIADITRHALDRVPVLFTQALDGLESGRLRAQPQDEESTPPFRCYPRLPRDGRIEWSAAAAQVHALVRALTRPGAGAFTYYRTADQTLEKLYVWKSRLVEDFNNDVGIPGHVIHNDPGAGESLVLTGMGVVALCEVSHGLSARPFAPGRVWTTPHLRLGMDVEEELFRLLNPD